MRLKYARLQIGEDIDSTLQGRAAFGRSCIVRRDPRRDIISRNGLADQKSLNVGDTGLASELCLSFHLDTFGVRLPDAVVAVDDNSKTLGPAPNDVHADHRAGKQLRLGSDTGRSPV